MNTDPIADLLTRIKNAYMAKKIEVKIPHSVVKESIVEVLEKYGFIDSFLVEGEGKDKMIQTMLRYDAETAMPAIEDVKRVSKPSVRQYVKGKEIKDVMNGYGISIISTNEGIMSGNEAKEKNIGGEVVAEVW